MPPPSVCESDVPMSALVVWMTASLGPGRGTGLSMKSHTSDLFHDKGLHWVRSYDAVARECRTRATKRITRGLGMACGSSRRPVAIHSPSGRQYERGADRSRGGVPGSVVARDGSGDRGIR